MSPQVFWMLLPETIVVLTAILVIVGGAFVSSSRLWTTCSVIGLLLAAFIVFNRQEAVGTVSGPIVTDVLSGLVRGLSLVVGLGLTLMFARRAKDECGGETLGMILLTTSGMMLVSSAANFVLLFLAMELISIPTYVLLFLGRPGHSSSEASVKYFLLSILSSALFLLGVGMLYGQAGSMDFATISNKMASVVDFETLPRGLMVAFMLTFGALCFKIAAVPFHFYAPDVYAAATNANTGLLAVVPKVAGIVAMVRLLALVTPVWGTFGWQVALVLSVLTMTLGNSCALWQTNVRRLLAYSSIAHAGYMLMGIAVAMADPEIEGLFNGVTATLFYTFMYSFASLGTFAVLSAISTSNHEVTDLKSLSGLYRQHPWLAASLAVCMFSLAGLPPLPGFWGKLGLLGGAVEIAGTGESFSGWFTFLAIVGALNAAIGAAYYLRVVANAFFGEPHPAEPYSRPAGGAAALVAIVAGALVLALGCVPSYFINRVAEVRATVTRASDAPEGLVNAAPSTSDDRS